MPDAREKAYGLDPNNPTDGAAFAANAKSGDTLKAPVKTGME